MPTFSTEFMNGLVSNDGLVAYFQFDENAGWRAKNLIGNDTAAYVGTKPDNWEELGYSGSAIRFNGTNDIRHMFSDGSNADLSLNAKTLSLRFQADAVDPARTQVLMDTGNGASGINVYLQGDQLVVGAWNHGDWQAYLNMDMPADGAWHQITVSFDADGSDTVSAYFDGELFGSADVGELGATSGKLTLGGVAGGTRIDGGQLPGSNRFAGLMDEVIILTRAVSDEEAQLMHQAVNGVISGTVDADTLDGTDGDDIVLANSGDDVVYSGNGDDRVYGEEGDDRLVGFYGDDTLYGGEGADQLLGHAGDDLLSGGEAFDILQGQWGNDTLQGGDGGDVLRGGDDNDLLMGEDGNDGMEGGRGDDTLDGGEGIDTAIFSGNFADYTITVDEGTVTVEALNDGTDDTDTLINVERLEFADDTYEYDETSGTWVVAGDIPLPGGGGGGTGGGETDPGFEITEGANPSVGINLNQINDYTAQGAFLNIMKTARPFNGISDTFQTIAGSEDIFTYDENGWVVSVDDPSIVSYTTSFMNDAPTGGNMYEAGRYVVKWDGEGTVNMSLTFQPLASDPHAQLEVVESEPGRLVFDYTPGAGAVRLTVTDFPEDSSNYLHNIQVVKEELEPLLDAGEAFTPKFLESFSGFNSIRFMQWMNTNDEVALWAEEGAPFREPDVDDMVSEDYFSFSNFGALQRGVQTVPVELMVELANKTGADPWFTIPFGATNEYIETFGTYVRDNLNPGLKAYFEYGNEVWNWGYGATHQALALGEDLFGEGTWQPSQEYYAVDAARMAHILNTLWGDDPADQLVTVISKQTVDSRPLLDLMMNAPNFVALGDDVPEKFADIAGMSPHEVGFDALGITSYFFTDLPANAEEVMAMVPNDTDEEWAAVLDRMINGDFGIMDRSSDWVGIGEDARIYGLQLVAYEANQHMIPPSDNPEFHEFTDRLFERPEMGELLVEMLNVWQSVGGGQSMMYMDIGGNTGVGRWGLRTSQLDENTHMFDAVVNFSETNGMWWGDERSADTFDDAFVLVSSPDTATLSGGDRDDLFLVNHLNVTNVNGGAGNDRLLIAGTQADYVLDGNLLTGNGYSITLDGIETILFEDNTSLTT